MTNKNRVMMAVVAVLLVAGICYQISLNRQTTSDTDQILTLLEDAQNAVERNDARGAMAVVSKDYKDGAGMTYTFLRMRATDALSSGIRPDITVLDRAVKADGSNASVDLHMRITDRRGEQGNVLLDHTFTILLRKEKLRKYVIFTTRQWRVTSVEGLGGVMESY